MWRRIPLKQSLKVSRRWTGFSESHFIEDQDWSEFTAVWVLLTLMFVPEADRMVCCFRQAAVVESMGWGVGALHVGNQRV
jgi:hypothetical protein